MFTLPVPKQTLFFAGPQRCGKTTALIETIAAVSRNAGVIVIARQSNIHWIKKEIEERSWATHKNVIYHGIESEWSINIDDFSTVALLENSLHSTPGFIELYVEPSKRVVELFEKKLPGSGRAVYVETHLGYTEVRQHFDDEPVVLG